MLDFNRLCNNPTQNICVLSVYNIKNGVPCAQILAVQEITGSQASNFLNIYKIDKNGSSAVRMYGPLNIATGKNGSPGGNTAGASPFHEPATSADSDFQSYI